MASNIGTVEIDLTVVGQPSCCRKWRELGWKFTWDKDTRFVGAEHPAGGRMSVLEVCSHGRHEIDINEIGKAIAMLLNGGVE